MEAFFSFVFSFFSFLEICRTFRPSSERSGRIRGPGFGRCERNSSRLLCCLHYIFILFPVLYTYFLFFRYLLLKCCDVFQVFSIIIIIFFKVWLTLSRMGSWLLAVVVSLYFPFFHEGLSFYITCLFYSQSITRPDINSRHKKRNNDDTSNIFSMKTKKENITVMNSSSTFVILHSFLSLSLVLFSRIFLYYFLSRSTQLSALPCLLASRLLGILVFLFGRREGERGERGRWRGKGGGSKEGREERRERGGSREKGKGKGMEKRRGRRREGKEGEGEKM